VAAEVGLRNPELDGPGTAAGLDAEPYRYGFFQAVRLLERQSPGREPVGRFVPPASEVVQFAVEQSLAFPASEVQALERHVSRPPLMRVNFMGLTGPQGVLPLAYTALIRARLRERDSSMRDFFDIFNHRIISLFYRGWQKYRFAIAYERDGYGPLTGYLLGLIGLGTPGLENRQAVPDQALVFYAGLLAQRPRSAESLKLLLQDYFDVPVEVRQFAGCWHALAKSDLCRVGETSLSTQLGWGAVVGDEVWYLQSLVRIVIGPLPLKRYQEFLPGGAAHEPLRSITKLLAEQELDFEVQLVLKREEAPPCVLGEETEGAARLGWLSWVKSKPLGRDPSDTILRL